MYFSLLGLLDEIQFLPRTYQCNNRCYLCILVFCKTQICIMYVCKAVCMYTCNVDKNRIFTNVTHISFFLA